ncbi:hypothetical protein RP75_23960 [Agrobacterium arsenijevicii]|uniref:Uncharacterized protein n=1 Tax=Agrobacterium arsenijevicii TaxID=1585697 RepID=A0ABR5D1H2_9HYPH|nr:hypothetical protein RP75_23960 [Agrobacterium arsenijevicii]
MLKSSSERIERRCCGVIAKPDSPALVRRCPAVHQLGNDYWKADFPQNVVKTRDKQLGPDASKIAAERTAPATRTTSRI